MKHFLFSASICILLLMGCARERNYDFISISAGSRGGVYQDVADSIAQWLTNSTENFSFKTIPSSGSLENMDRLEKGMADLIIVQRDVASRAYFKRDAPFRHMEIIMPLFPEGLHIIVNDTTGVISFETFARMVEEHRVHSIAADNESTVSYQTAKDVFSMMGVQVKDLTFDTRPLGEAVNDFNAGLIDCIVYYTTFPSTRLNAITDSMPRAIVSFSNDDLRYLGSHMSFVDSYSFTQPYAFIHANTKINTIGTWAFLIGKTDVAEYLQNNLNEDISQIVLQNLIGKETGMHVVDPKHIKPIEIFKLTYLDASEDLFQVNRNGDTYEIVTPRDDIEFITRGIPMLDSTEDFLDPPKINMSRERLKMVICILVGLFLLVFIILKRPKALNYTLWLKSARYIIGAIALTLLFIGIQYYIYVLEIKFSIEHSVTSPITQLDTVDRVLWLLVMAFTGYEQQIFPYANVSKTLIGILSVFSYLFIFVGVLFELAREGATRKRRMGLIRVQWQNHILITGWNHSSPAFVVKLIEATKPPKRILSWFGRGFKSIANGFIIMLNRISDNLNLPESYQLRLIPNYTQIVVIHPEISDSFQRNETLRLELEYGRRLLYVNGRANEHAVLEQANAESASLVLHLLRDHNNGEVESLVKQNLTTTKTDSPLYEIKFKRNQNNEFPESLVLHNLHRLESEKGGSDGAQISGDDAKITDHERMFYDNRTILDARNINSYSKFVSREKNVSKKDSVDEYDYIRNVAAFYNYEKLNNAHHSFVKTAEHIGKANTDNKGPQKISTTELHNIEINELVDREKLLVELMANALEYDGSLQFILEMLNYGGYCDLFSVDTMQEDHQLFHGEYYKHVFEKGKAYDLLLIGVRRALLNDITVDDSAPGYNERSIESSKYVLEYKELQRRLDYFKETMDFSCFVEEIDNDIIAKKFNEESNAESNEKTIDDKFKSIIGNFVISPPEEVEADFRIKYGDKLYFLAPDKDQMQLFIDQYHKKQPSKFAKVLAWFGINKLNIKRAKLNEATSLNSNHLVLGNNVIKEQFSVIIYGDPSGVNWSTLHTVVRELGKSCKEVYWLSSGFDQLKLFSDKSRGLDIIAHHGQKGFLGLNVFDDADFDLYSILSQSSVKVIIMPEEDGLVADENVLLSLMRIYDKIGSLSKVGEKVDAQKRSDEKSKFDVRYLCVLNHYTYRQSFYDFTHTEILCLPEISDGVLIQSAINPDFSKLLSEVLGIADPSTKSNANAIPGEIAGNTSGTSRNEFAVIKVDQNLLDTLGGTKELTYQLLVDNYSYLDSGIIIGIIQSDNKIEKLNREKPFDIKSRLNRAVWYGDKEAFYLTHTPRERVIVSPRKYIKDLIKIQTGDKIIVLRNRPSATQSEVPHVPADINT